MNSRLELLTFETLVEKIEQRKQRAQTEDARAGWEKLLAVARSFAGRSDADVDPAVGRRWALVRIRVSGYQGIAAKSPLEIELDPTPGITVLHGANGSGKSSIADAIETALQGSPRVPMTGTGGKAPLWERVHCGRDSDEAIIDLELLSGRERLEIRCRLNSASQPVEHDVTLYGDNASTRIDLSKTTWKSALAGHRPVFGYAAIERRIRIAKDLQEFLDSLLAFGGCFDTFKQEVDRCGKKSKDAKTEWQNALRSAQRKVAEVDRERGQEDQLDLPAIVWPGVDDDVDTWLLSTGLTESGTAIPEVTEEHYQHLVVAANEASEALIALEVAATTSLHAQLAGPLKQLHAAAREIGDKGLTCPVCATSDVNWFVVLTDSIDDLVDLTSTTETIQQKLGALRTATKKDLAIVHDVLTARAQADSASLPGAFESEKFVALLDRDGLNATPEIRSATRELCAWIQSETWSAIVRDARRESNRQRQWRRARRSAVDEFVAVWRHVGTDAREAAAWDSATNRFRELHHTLREDRTELLTTLTRARVQSLLSDADLSVMSMSVQGTKASIKIVDKANKEMTLAMLSAGQRNALLLSPLLAASGTGPFGFLVLDDPVHVLDQLRVDCLAAILHELSADRRIVVLTHDERLYENLRAREPTTEVRAVLRDPLTGVVTAPLRGAMWDELLTHAAEVLALPSALREGVTTSPTDLVRGLCRQALDNALRQFVMRACVEQGHEPHAHVESLDAANRTKDRLALARNMHTNDMSASDTVNAAEACVSGYLDGWNRAAHGNPPSSEATREEVAAARRACETLAGTVP